MLFTELGNNKSWGGFIVESASPQSLDASGFTDILYLSISGAVAALSRRNHDN